MGKFYPEFAGPFSRLLGLLEARPVAVVGHARPRRGLLRLPGRACPGADRAGSRAICVNPDAVPRRLAYAVRGLPFIRTDEALLLPEGTAAVFVDCADHARAGERLAARFPRPAGAIDHHLSNEGFAEISIVDSNSAAACEILAGVFLDAGLEIDAATATALYAGIVTGTGQFRYGSTSQRSFVLAGELVARGASPPRPDTSSSSGNAAGKLQLLRSTPAAAAFLLMGSLSVNSNGPTSTVSIDRRRKSMRMAILSHSWTTTSPSGPTSATRASPRSRRPMASSTVDLASVSAGESPSARPQSSSIPACSAAVMARDYPGRGPA